MKLIVGLGNPGKIYEKTRHNVGFWVLDQLSTCLYIPITKEKWKAFTGEGSFEGEKIILMKPLTYMNLSGEAVRMAMDWLKLEVEDIMVVYDDLDIPVGQIKLRQKGSSGGHNGIKSIIRHIGTEKFKRIKIGIGKPINQQPVADYVLSPFRQEDIESIYKMVSISAEAIELWIKENFLKAMNRFNTK